MAPGLAPLVVALIALACVAHSAPFDQFTRCDTCVAAGFGWSNAKQRCGGFSNTQCDGDGTAAVPVADAPNVWYETTVHILVSFCGNNYVTTEKMAPYLRSLLWHRSCKIHFHVLADRGAWKDTKALFKQEASRFPQVEYTFLPREENDAWIQRANDLQRNLQFPTSLPGCSFVRIWADGILPDVDAVIVMDTNDEIILGDIADLWSIFAEFDEKQFVGSVLEQTQHYNRYANRQHQHYDPNWNDPNPVMDEYGFNCGVLLLNLTRMRDRRWTADDYPLALATEAVNKPALAGVGGRPGEAIRSGKGLRYFGFLAENDVWQYAVMKEPHIIHKIPCSWDIILYGGGPGLYSYGSARTNPRGCAVTPIRLMHGTGGSFKKHPLGTFHNFYRGDSGLRKESLYAGGSFQPRPIRMDPGLNTLAIEEDPHRARHDRLAGWAAPAPPPGGQVHVMMFVCGDSYAAKIVPFLKALLFHRSTHLHFHFVVDSAAMPALKTAWEGMGGGKVPQVTVDYIAAEPHIESMERVYPRKFNKQDYMGSCCRIRLIAEQILPNVDSVIILDGGDQLIFEDIARLWAHFGNFNQAQYAGFAIEPASSRWYHRLADRNHPNGDKNGNWEGVYPHGDGVSERELHRGVNAGVQLLNLTRMRSANTKRVFPELAEEGTSKQMTLFGHLGDQDVWNFHLIRHPEVVYRLGCEWNAQLGGSKVGLPEGCLPLKILHGNAKSFEETESRRQQADGSIETTMRPKHALAVYVDFWATAPNDFLHYHFEAKDPSMASTWASGAPVVLPRSLASGKSFVKSHDEL